MIETVNILLIVTAGFIAMASPGPATLAIAGTSVSNGRRYGLALAAGVTCGSILWSVAAALGLGALMAANTWAFEILRYCGAAYLLFLAFKSAKAALRPAKAFAAPQAMLTLRSAYAKGLALHLTNPKAVLFFGSLYAIGIPQGAPPNSLILVITALGLLAALIFHGYALLFSSAPIAAAYVRLRRWFEAVFAIAFGAAAIKILTARLN